MQQTIYDNNIISCELLGCKMARRRKSVNPKRERTKTFKMRIESFNDIENLPDLKIQVGELINAQDGHQYEIVKSYDKIHKGVDGKPNYCYVYCECVDADQDTIFDILKSESGLDAEKIPYSLETLEIYPNGIAFIVGET